MFTPSGSKLFHQLSPLPGLFSLAKPSPLISSSIYSEDVVRAGETNFTRRLTFDWHFWLPHISHLVFSPLIFLYSKRKNWKQKRVRFPPEICIRSVLDNPMADMSNIYILVYLYLLYFEQTSKNWDKGERYNKHFIDVSDFDKW